MPPKPMPSAKDLTGLGDETLWTDSLEAVFETDAETIAAALPPSLEPAREPLARFEISIGTAADGSPCGTAWFGVNVTHQGVPGEFALFSTATTDAQVAVAREFFGQPCKQAETEAIIKANRVQHHVKRRGHTVARLVATVDEVSEPTDTETLEYAFRALPALAPDADPQRAVEVVKIRRAVVERRAVKTTGVLRMGVSPLDPVGAFRVQRMVSMRLSQRCVDLSSEIVGSVPSEKFAPFLHHRYDLIAQDPT